MEVNKGICFQWGYIQHKTAETITFPITFTTFYARTFGANSGNDNVGMYLKHFGYNSTNSGFYIPVASTTYNYYYMAIGEIN